MLTSALVAKSSNTSFSKPSVFADLIFVIKISAKLCKRSTIFQGRFTMSAKHHTTIAEMYETDYPDLEQSMNHYQKAADYYKGEESKRFVCVPLDHYQTWA